MVRTLFVDSLCNEPYDPARLAMGGLGGTEATTVRVAEGLSGQACVAVAQSPRMVEAVSAGGVRYLPFHHRALDALPEAEAVVLLRAPKLLPLLRRRYPEAKLFLWLHCYQGKHRKWLNALCMKTRTTIVAVSETHAAWIRHFLHRYRAHGRDPSLYEQARVVSIYNPVAVYERCADVPVDPNKLLFFSSPHKGLDEVLAHFERVVAVRPQACLYLANPGYIDLDPHLARKNTVVLGALSHQQVLRHVAEAFCVFYPQSRFAETFGLVFAEANALGTPVLAHDIGSAVELLGSGSQIVDARDGAAVVDRLQSWWADGRPHVKPNPDFQLDQILRQWRTLLST